MPTLISHKISVVLDYGDSDTVVPYIENDKILEDAYRLAGLPPFCIGKANCGHHPHGLKYKRKVYAFIREHI